MKTTAMATVREYASHLFPPIETVGLLLSLSAPKLGSTNPLPSRACCQPPISGCSWLLESWCAYICSWPLLIWAID